MSYKILLAEDEKLLHLPFLHADSFVVPKELLEYLWGHHIFLNDNTLNVHITGYWTQILR